MDADRRPQPPDAAPPIAMISGFLDFLRSTLVWKISGVSDVGLRREMTPSGASLLGLVKHSAAVERYWFQTIFTGIEEQPPRSERTPGADWRVEPEERATDIMACYQAAIADSRAVVAKAAWDDQAMSPDLDVTVGWILTHMVEEVARHCGHADILRERIDGQAGE